MESVSERLVNFILDSVCIPFFNNTVYREGFIFGLGAAFVIGFVTRYVLFARGLILAFFRPSQLPATRPGPSPFDRLVGCFFGFVRFVIFILVLGLLGYIIYLGIN
jgi:hypothetical protein